MYKQTTWRVYVSTRKDVDYTDYKEAFNAGTMSVYNVKEAMNKH